MKAVVFHEVGDIRLDRVEDPKLEAGTDAIVKLTAFAECEVSNPHGPQAGTALRRPEVVGPVRRAAGRVRAGAIRAA